jgi:interferon gamma-inducible protein 30
MYQACAIKHNNDTATWWPFVDCMENSRDPVSAASGCATKANIDWSTIQSCAGPNPDQGSADDGNPLMHSISVATESLQPPHQWTPWVVLNGKPLTSSQLDQKLTTLICNAYTGPKPAACSKMGAKLDMREQ